MGSIENLKPEDVEILYKWVKEYWKICKIREYDMSDHIKRLLIDRDLEPLLYIFEDRTILMYELIHHLDLYGLVGEEINLSSEELTKKFGKENIDEILNRNSNTFLNNIFKTLNTFGINPEEISLPSGEKASREDIHDVLKETNKSHLQIIEAILEKMRSKEVGRSVRASKNNSVEVIKEGIDNLKRMDCEVKRQLDESVKAYYNMLNVK